ncbi:MAG: protein phosphatase 2C domain-containing protein [Xanthomonadales bacterium]|nr:protein phosphatase 2C domain-containing protein [Xanthomonadales bacterium]
MKASVPMLSWVSDGWTEIGPQRSHNEDALLERRDMLLWAVADGMGGHSAGEVASGRIVDQLSACALSERLGQCRLKVEAALHRCHDGLAEYARQNTLGIVGSTAVVLVARGNYCCVLWVGDSRAYRLRNGRLSMLTRDHSHVFELMDQGYITAQQAEHHPQANAVTRAVGGSSPLRVDSLTFEVQPDDRFLLCSDGLSGSVVAGEMKAILASSQDHPGQQLVTKAVQNNTPDNVTAVVITACRQDIATQ